MGREFVCFLSLCTNHRKANAPISPLQNLFVQLTFLASYIGSKICIFRFLWGFFLVVFVVISQPGSHGSPLQRPRCYSLSLLSTVGSYTNLLAFIRQSREGELIKLLKSNERSYIVNSILCFASLTETTPSQWSYFSSAAPGLRNISEFKLQSALYAVERLY